MHLTKNTLLSMKKHNGAHLLTKNFRSLEWFRPPGVQCDDDSYGNSIGTYKIEQTLNLLNLGDMETRNEILQHTSLTREDLNPDTQYSCHQANTKVHRAILNANHFASYDGTILTSDLIEPSLKHDLEGAEEIVLFTDRMRSGITLYMASL